MYSYRIFFRYSSSVGSGSPVPDVTALVLFCGGSRAVLLAAPSVAADVATMAAPDDEEEDEDDGDSCFNDST